MSNSPELDIGIKHLNAVELRDGDFAYHAEETDEWYRVTATDVEELGAALRDKEPNAYSFWCAGCGERVDDTDHDALDEIAEAGGDPAYRCQCGPATGQRCDWRRKSEDAQAELVQIRWVPESDRGNAEASNTFTYGAYAQTLYVSPECAEALRYNLDEEGERAGEDPFVRVVGPAYVPALEKP